MALEQQNGKVRYIARHEPGFCETKLRGHLLLRITGGIL